MRALPKSSLLALFGSLASPAIASELPDFVSTISASTIAVISDGDVLAQTYATGRLAPREAGYRDLLTVLSITDGEIITRTLTVSNSVTASLAELGKGQPMIPIT